MNTYTQTAPSKKPVSMASLKGTIQNWAGILTAPARDVARRRKAVTRFKGLLQMSDYMLHDIGLSRAEVLQDRLRFRLTGELPDYIHE
ncbi:DUF1127 domain-containing protein [Roseobacter sp. A03A-229]